MSVDQTTSEFLSPEEAGALLPLRAKWEKELASLEQQLTALTSRKSELTRMLASLNGIIPKDDGQSAAAVASAIPEQLQAGAGGQKAAPAGAAPPPALRAPPGARAEAPPGAVVAARR